MLGEKQRDFTPKVVNRQVKASELNPGSPICYDVPAMVKRPPIISRKKQDELSKKSNLSTWMGYAFEEISAAVGGLGSEVDRLGTEVSSLTHSIKAYDRQQQREGVAASIRELGNLVFIGLVVAQAFSGQRDNLMIVVGFAILPLSYLVARWVSRGGEQQ